MTQRSLEQRLLLLAGALLLLVPLAWLPGVVFSSIIPKGALIRLAGLLSGAALLLLATRRKVVAQADATALCLGFLVILWIIASMAGVSPSHSLSGDMERMFGVATWGALAVGYAGLRTLLQSTDDWKRLERLALIPGAIAIAVGILLVATTGSRTGTFGNPSFFGIYATVLGGVALFVAAEPSAGRWRWPAILVGVLSLLTAVGIGERAAALSVVGAAAVAGVFRLGLGPLRNWLSANNRRPWLLSGASMALLAMLAVAGWAALLSAMGNDVALQFRSRLWGSALTGFAARPALGFGPENFAVVSSQFIDPAIYEYGENPYVDRAHNAYLDHLLAAGPLGLLGYLVLWASMVVHALRAWLRDRLSVWQASIAIGLVAGYMSYLFLWFEDLSSLTLMLVLAATLATRARGTPLLEVGAERREAALGPVIAAVSLALVLVLGYQTAGRVVLAASSAQTAQQQELTVERRLAAYQRALDYGAPETREIVLPYVDYLQNFTAEIPLIQGDAYRLQVMGENVDRAIRGLDDAIAADPQMDVWWLQRGSLLAFAAGLYGDERYLDYALADVEQALELSPDRFRNYHFLARLKLMQGDAEGAVAVVDTAISIFDRYPESWWTRAEMLAAAGRWEEIGESMDRVYQLNSIPRSDVVRSLAEASLSAGRRALAIQLMDDLIGEGEERGWDSRTRAADADLDWIIRRRIALHEDSGEVQAAGRLAGRWGRSGN